MLKKHKNGFFDIIKKNGLDPESFSVGEPESDVFEICFLDSPLRFKVFLKSDNYMLFDFDFVEFLPSPKYKYPDEIITYGCSIEDIYETFESWIQEHVKEYIDELLLPDLWEQLAEQKPLISDDMLDAEETSPFTDDQKVQLKMSIDEFRLLIKEKFEPTEEKLIIINNRLDYLTDSFDRLNRIDWRGLAISTVLSISVALSLGPEEGKALFELFKQVFTKIILQLQ
ncbi:hypothetical protein HQ587_00155 [bacterium]|nr:hypothetical protein [bacterium]